MDFIGCGCYPVSIAVEENEKLADKGTRSFLVGESPEEKYMS